MFERFTDRARRVVVLAQEEARLLDHNYIGTEHILLGLIREDEGVAAMALRSLGVPLARTRAHVEHIVGHGGSAPSGHIPFTPRAKKVLEFSLREALQLGHNYIGTEHILLGLLREGEGVAAQVLIAEGVELDRARHAVIVLVSGGTIDGPPDPSTGETSASIRVVRSTAGGAPPGPVSGFGLRLGGSGARCSFCLRTVERVDHYVRGRDGVICDSCVARAQELVASAGEGTPKRLRLPPPFLPQVQTADAEAGVIHAFETVLGGDAPVDARLALIQDSGDLRDVVTTLIETSRIVGNPDIWVDMVRFVEHGEASVDFAALLPGGGRYPMHGFAVLDGNRWKVSRATYLNMASLAGVPAPPTEPPAAGPESPPGA